MAKNILLIPGHLSENSFCKSMRFLITSDTPKLWLYFIYRASQYQVIKDIVFGYVGFASSGFPLLGS